MAWGDRDIPLGGAAALAYADRDVPLVTPEIPEGRLSIAMRAAFDAGAGPFVPVATIALPGGDLRVAPVGYASMSEGLFEPKMTDMGRITEAVSEPGGTIAGLELTIGVSDTDRYLARILEGALGEDVAGSAVTVRLASPGVAPSAWHVLFVGVLVQMSFPEPFRVALVARTEDLAMQREAPKGGWTLNEAIFGNIGDSGKGTTGAVVYGYQDSQNYEATGMVEFQHADDVGHRYVASGPVGVGRVYDEGVVVAATNYAVSREEIGGRVWTVIDFTSARAGAITADVTGYDLVDPDGGAVGTNAAEQIAHYLSNFVFGDWSRGAWLGQSPRIDEARLSDLATALGQRGFRGGRVITEPVAGYDEVGAMLVSYDLVAWWTASGQLALAIEDPCDLRVYPSSVVSRLIARNAAGFSASWDDLHITSAVVAQFNTKLGEPMSTLEVVDPKRAQDANATMDMLWLAVE